MQIQFSHAEVEAGCGHKLHNFGKDYFRTVASIEEAIWWANKLRVQHFTTEDGTFYGRQGKEFVKVSE